MQNKMRAPMTIKVSSAQSSKSMRNSPGRTLTLQAAYKAKEVEGEEVERKKPSVDYDRFPKK